MNNRIGSVVAVATVMMLTTGCSGMKNFLFGRGARCGACAPAPQFGNMMQAPAPQQVPYQPAAPAYQPAPQYQAPGCQGRRLIRPRSLFGGNNYPQTPGCNSCNQVQPHAMPSMQCESCYQPAYSGCQCGTAMPYAGDCGCNAPGHYGPNVVSDPYLSSEYHGGQVIGESVIGSPVVEGGVIGTPALPSVPVQTDDFTARKVDSDGNKILWEEPLPPGTTPL